MALVERELVGGECSFWACMPSKALLRPAELLAEVQRVPGARQAVTGELDVAAALARRDEVDPRPRRRRPAAVAGGPRHHPDPRRRPGSTASAGSASATSCIEARRAVVIAVGSGAAIPPVPGLEEIDAWTNRAGDDGRCTVPKRLTVLGGGVGRMRAGAGWASLGARVTLVEAEPRLLPGEEPFAGEQAGRGAARPRASTCGSAPTRPRRRRSDAGDVHARRWRTASSSQPMSCWWPSGASPTPTISAWRPSASSPAPRSRSTTACGCRATRLALRDRRRQRPRAAHARGQVPGAMVAVATIMNREAARGWDGARPRGWCSPSRRSPPSA